MKKVPFIIVLLLTGCQLFSQAVWYTKTGSIHFDANSALEKVEALNRNATCVLDPGSGDIQLSVLMKGFEFAKALMQEHFNENYVESDKFPSGTFKGTVVNNKDVNYAKDGDYPAQVKGKLTLHGITRDIESSGTIRISQGKILIQAAFSILLKDYAIQVPSIVSDKISSTVKISVDMSLAPLKK